MSDDQGFEVVDKRKVKAEEETESPEEAVSEQQESAEMTAPEEPEAEEREQAGVADVYTVVTWMIEILATSAWQKLGLQVDPGSGKIEKDLDQARTAIDCVMALSDHISPHLDDTGRRELKGIVSDLQLNFVNQNK
ncbi:MAG: DUF1844 domain-containing protein [Armatimonadota bacterium]|nr:DUF1844 domain-containing protein [Armatimonadota bacterium]